MTTNQPVRKVLKSYVYGDDRATAQVDFVEYVTPGSNKAEGLKLIAYFSTARGIVETIIEGNRERDFLLAMADGNNPAEIYFDHCC